jgi:DNA-binding HxlR family transcriptional regulator
MRTYAEYCSLAKSLDVVGDRWTLLIVRELTLRGACRYTDLRNGLPGIATNLLADRLRELEQAGVVQREDAPAPIATTLFHLTPRGEELRPVLEHLVRWGIPLMSDQSPGDAVRSHWFAWALELMLIDHQPDAPSVTIALQTGDRPIVLEAGGGSVHARLGTDEEADVTLTGPPRSILGLLLGIVDLEDARRIGLSYEGDPAVIERIRAAAYAEGERRP